MAFDYGAVLQHPQVCHVISDVFTRANCNDKKRQHNVNCCGENVEQKLLTDDDLQFNRIIFCNEHKQTKTKCENVFYRNQ